jgi:hypothetical protein
MKSKHKVHVYAIVRVPFEVEAESFEDAAREVLNAPATHERLHAIPGYAEDFEEELVVDRLNKNGHMVASNVVLVNDVRVTLD